MAANVPFRGKCAFRKWRNKAGRQLLHQKFGDIFGGNFRQFFCSLLLPKREEFLNFLPALG